MDENPDEQELFELLDALCDERLDASQGERLQQLLKDNNEAQQTYFDFLDTHLALRRLARTRDAENRLPFDFDAPDREWPDPRRPRRLRPFRIPWAVLGAAAAVLVAVTIAIAMRTGRSSVGRGAGAAGVGVTKRGSIGDATPRLTQSAGAKFFGGRSLPNGARLPFGEEYALTEGLLEIEFAQGATAIIRAPAVFEVADRTRLLMKIGRCSVHAPEGAKGFCVETPVAEVIDLGTRFSVDVSDTGEAEVQVVDGLAEVYPGGPPHKRSQPVRLATGQAQKYALDRELTADVIAFDASKYTAQLPDRIVTYTASERDGGGAETLLNVSVQRGGTLRTYPTQDLIGIDLIHYKVEPRGSIATGLNEADPEQGDPSSRRRLELLDRDAKLTTGVINPGRSTVPLARDPVMGDPEDPRLPNTPGFAVRFHEPVINSAGPDVVLFDVQLIIHREKGDPFHVSPLHFAPGLRTHTILDYDIDLLSPEARTLASIRVSQFKTAIRSLSELVSGTHNSGRQTSVRTKALAVGIDLSDLGYKPGAAAEGLFFQAMPTERYPAAVIDPVFIAGLPPVGQPIARAAAR
jgi:ferric-dicitrate binding protein FerR (iron transport regulator)